MANESEIYSLTGCISSCEKDETRVVEASELVTMDIWDSQLQGHEDKEWDTHALKLHLYFGNGQYIEKEHYVIYDYDSLFADVGGYLGLLLGMSLHGLFEVAEGWWHKLALKRW